MCISFCTTVAVQMEMKVWHMLLLSIVTPLNELDCMHVPHPNYRREVVLFDVSSCFLNVL
jgi:hypothetical protein